jgi:hypothetical protein
MSKRLFVLMITGILLVFSTAAYAKESPVHSITEKQINESFTIPSTATRTVSNLKVKVQAEGVRVSFDMTVKHNGTSNTFGIIAILIGLKANEVEIENKQVSDWQASDSQRREVAGLVEQAWGNYLTDAFGEPMTTQGIIMSDGRICNPRWGC